MLITAMLAMSLHLTPIPVQFDDGGPVYRRGNPEYHRRGPVPQIRGPGWGPEMHPCIYDGDCGGPKYQDRVPQGYPMPRYEDPRGRYYEDY
jgi:hypothetical protein